MTTTKRLSVSLPAGLFKELEAERSRHHTSRSEFIRHLFNMYKVFGRKPAMLSPAEAEDLRRARAEVTRGRFVTLSDIKDDLGGDRR